MVGQAHGDSGQDRVGLLATQEAGADLCLGWVAGNAQAADAGEVNQELESIRVRLQVRSHDVGVGVQSISDNVGLGPLRHLPYPGVIPIQDGYAFGGEGLHQPSLLLGDSLQAAQESQVGVVDPGDDPDARTGQFGQMGDLAERMAGHFQDSHRMLRGERLQGNRQAKAIAQPRRVGENPMSSGQDGSDGPAGVRLARRARHAHYMRVVLS